MTLRTQPLKLRDQLIENWVDDVLMFANLANADDFPNQVGPDAQRDWADPDKLSFIDVLYNFVGNVGPDGYGASQSKLRKALNALTEQGVTLEVNQLVSETIDSIPVQGAITFEAGYLRFSSIAQSQSHDQWWAVGVAALLHAGLGDRVRICGWEKCARYFVDWPGRKGQSKFYCCPAHQNAERQRRHRERQKLKRKQQAADQSMGD